MNIYIYNTHDTENIILYIYIYMCITDTSL